MEHNQHRKVLVVDDDKDHADILAELLEAEGFDCDVVNSGEEALSSFRQKHYDLGLLDIKLPGINGLQVYSNVRASGSPSRMIMMTGYRSGQVLREVFNCENTFFLVPPYSPENMTAMIRHNPPGSIFMLAGHEARRLRDVIMPRLQEVFSVALSASGDVREMWFSENSRNLVWFESKSHALDTMAEFLELYKTIPREASKVVICCADRELSSLADVRDIPEVVYKPINPRALLEIINHAA